MSDDFTAYDDDVPLTDAQREELDRRLEARQREPGARVPWADARARILGSR